ncbi:MAG: hypothetical protein AAB519_00815 [Patescibacteria group bacterium]
MEVDIFTLFLAIVEGVQDFLDHSLLFAAVKFFLFVYVAVLFVDIVLLLLLRDISSDLKATLFGGQRPLASKGKMIKRWEAVLLRLESENVSQFKAAILEADAMANDVLGSIGYKGNNMKERLESVAEYQVESKDDLVSVHALRNRIISEPDFTLSQEEAKEALEKYRRFFDEVELL